MHEQSAPNGPAETLLFQNKHSVRIVMLDGVPWFSLSDIGTAMNRNHHSTDLANGPNFPDCAKRTLREQTAGRLQDTTFLSPVGVWLFTELVDAGAGQAVAAWARREAQRLCPSPVEGDPAIFLTLMPDGKLPPKPLKYSGRRTEWLDLRDSPEGQRSLMPSESRVALQRRLLDEAEAKRKIVEASQHEGIALA